LPGELCFVAERDLNLVGKASFEPRTVDRRRLANRDWPPKPL
jgi:hypothetical protein